MKFTVLTLFPDMVRVPLAASLLGKAAQRGILDIAVVDVRDYATDRHRTADDVPFGGGQGMVMKVEPVVAAIEDARRRAGAGDHRVIAMTPQGRPFTQDVARELAAWDGLILVCGRYEGMDERIRAFVDDEISIGDYVLSGGELAAMVVVDAVARLVPGVLGNEASPLEESFSNGLLEYPQYTRPREFRGLAVPDVLLSGDHARIARWRRRQSLLRTRKRRPDLFARLHLTDEDRKLLDAADEDEEEPMLRRAGVER